MSLLLNLPRLLYALLKGSSKTDAREERDGIGERR